MKYNFVEEKIKEKPVKVPKDVPMDKPTKIITEIAEKPTISESKIDLKNELRQLIDCVGSGHKKYELLGYSNILQAKARIWKIIDLL